MKILESSCAKVSAGIAAMHYDTSGLKISVNIIKKNTDVFNKICKINFSIADMEIIYTKLGNGINRELAKRFVKAGFNLSLLKGG